MTYLLNITSDDRQQGEETDSFSLGFAPAISIPGNWSLALESLSIWYSWHNISSDYGNQTFRYYNGSVWKNITITPGLYTIDDIDTFVKSAMKTNGDSTVDGDGNDVFNIDLTPNYNTFKLRISVSGGYQVDLTVGNLYVIFGFTPIIVTTTQEGVNNVNITNSVNRILVHVDCVTGSYKGSTTSDILYSFNADSAPSSLLQIKPNRLIYLPIQKSGYLYNMRIKITDQQNRRLNLNGEEVSLSLVLKKNVRDI
jgi:hypothetical protein